MDGVDESHLPPYITAEEVDFGDDADLDTVATVLGAVSSLMLIIAYTEFDT